MLTGHQVAIGDGRRYVAGGVHETIGRHQTGRLSGDAAAANRKTLEHLLLADAHLVTCRAVEESQSIKSATGCRGVGRAGNAPGIDSSLSKVPPE